MRCDVCGLPDLHNGQGDGIGSCECPPCDGGEAADGSVFCTCPPDDAYDADDYDPDYDLSLCQPGEPVRDVVTVELPGVSR